MSEISLALEVDKLREDVETLAQQSIVWRSSEELGGRMSSSISKGTPVIKYRCFSQAGAAEELLHIKLGLTGHPHLRPEFGFPMILDIIGMLENCVHHHLIYPQLEKMGFKPKESESNGVAHQLDTLKKTKLSRLAEEPRLVALFAMVYARSFLDTEDDFVRQAYDSFFSLPELNQAKIMAKEIVEIIQNQTIGTPEVTKKTFQKCLSTFQIEQDVTILDYPESIGLTSEE